MKYSQKDCMAIANQTGSRLLLRAFWVNLRSSRPHLFRRAELLGQEAPMFQNFD
jgi:hypothetical protein